ncbi:bacteriocin immunity protein [Paenibacillus eucommiae]|uniref:E9imm peptide n=1 Tax=Paenibacillus eucommiae TaxID=1355755 RepID=A0ABS4J744_9BACL|nr:bacteriocin immunity protein [Paenibacillus eucommiae]MBP1995071.1 hypothetical protein [Paenibacillus eucommiae]
MIAGFSITDGEVTAECGDTRTANYLLAFMETLVVKYKACRKELDMERLTRTQILDLVTRLCNGEGSEEEADEWIEMLQRNVPHPEVSSLIFWPEEELTPEEIVEQAFNYKPIALKPPYPSGEDPRE